MKLLYTSAKLWQRKRMFLRKRNNLTDCAHVKLSHKKIQTIVPLFDLKLTILTQTSTSKLILYFTTKGYSLVFVFNKTMVYKIQVHNSDILQIVFIKHIRGTEIARMYFIKFLHIFFRMVLIRVRMRGRLYRIYTRNVYRDLQYRFGRVHMVTVFVTGFYVKFLKKRFFRIFGYNFPLLPIKAGEIHARFPTNIYTRRGVCIGGREVRTRIGKTVKWY